MKILSLSGENLASLTGNLPSIFAGGALGAAGLLPSPAIPAPAEHPARAICLALYDEMPRFIANPECREVGRMDDEEAQGQRRAASQPRPRQRFCRVQFRGCDGRIWHTPAGRCAGLATAPRGAFEGQGAA